jgi:hypothetical protein
MRAAMLQVFPLSVDFMQDVELSSTMDYGYILNMMKIWKQI